MSKESIELGTKKSRASSVALGIRPSRFSNDFPKEGNNKIIGKDLTKMVKEDSKKRR